MFEPFFMFLKFDFMDAASISTKKPNTKRTVFELPMAELSVTTNQQGHVFIAAVAKTFRVDFQNEVVIILKSKEEIINLIGYLKEHV